MRVKYPVTCLELDPRELVELIACLRVARRVATTTAGKMYLTIEFDEGFKEQKADEIINFTKIFFDEIK